MCPARVRSPIYIFLCTVLVTLPRLGQISYHFNDSRMILELCNKVHTNTYRWSTFSDWFHNVSFTMQLHDHNWSLSLKVMSRTCYIQCWAYTAHVEARVSRIGLHMNRAHTLLWLYSHLIGYQVPRWETSHVTSHMLHCRFTVPACWSAAHMYTHRVGYRFIHLNWNLW